MDFAHDNSLHSSVDIETSHEDPHNFHNKEIAVGNHENFGIVKGGLQNLENRTNKVMLLQLAILWISLRTLWKNFTPGLVGTTMALIYKVSDLSSDGLGSVLEVLKKLPPCLSY
ncbi:hypothetical protein Tco_0323694 [Tanacetum coccineum]